MDHKDEQADDASKPEGGKPRTETQTEAPQAGGPNAPAAVKPKHDEAADRESNRKGGYGTG